MLIIFFTSSIADKQMKLFPATRYMGSKSKLLDYIWSASSQFSFDSVIDLFSGSGVVSYMYKTHGKAVLSNKLRCFVNTKFIPV